MIDAFVTGRLCSLKNIEKYREKWLPKLTSTKGYMHVFCWHFSGIMSRYWIRTLPDCGAMSLAIRRVCFARQARPPVRRSELSDRYSHELATPRCEYSSYVVKDIRE